MKADKKGKELENAVFLIESLIFESNPSLKNSNFTIEKNKIVIVNEVRHEIDVFVEIDLGDDYKSTYIFECKNWDHKNVGKSEIIEFTEKIKVSNSQKGFFLAKGFSSYAIAQSKLDSRIKLRTVYSEDFDLRTIPVPQHLHTREENEDVYTLNYQISGTDELIKVTDNESFLKKPFIVKGNNVNSDKFIKHLLGDMFDKKFKHERTDLLDSGSYYYDFALIFNFNPNVLNISGGDISRIRIDATFKTEIVKPVIKSKYEIEGKGRIVTVGYPIPGQNELILEIIERQK